MSNYEKKKVKPPQKSIAHGSTATNVNGASMAPPSPFSAPVQKKEPKTEEDKKEDKGVDVDIKVLPPSVQMALWRFKLYGDTSAVGLDYKHDDFSTSLKYKYGSALSLGVKKGPFSLGSSYKPGGNDFSVNAGYKQGPFNAGLGVQPLSQSMSLSFGYGAPLAPMPDAFSSTMQAGGDAATNMMMQGPMAPLNDPMGYYSANKDNIDDITKAGKMAADLAKQGKGIKFGAGLRLSASQLSGFAITAGVQGAF